jgi:Xaa-Pro dipeptidase
MAEALLSMKQKHCMFNISCASSLDVKSGRYDVDEVKLTTCLLKDYSIWFRAHSDSTIYFLHAEPDPYIPRSVSYLSSSTPTFDTTSLLPAMDASRTIKFPHEIALIRHANNVSTKAHTAVLRSLGRFRNEREIAAQFTQTCMAHAAPQQSYEIIAGSGPNAAILHYVKNDEPLKGRQLVCLDAGAEYLNYSSDVTRTFPISGYWTKEAKSIHDLVQKMQDSCVERIKPGISYLDLYYLAHSIALTGLMDLRILHNGTEDEIKKSGVVSIFFPHGLGHHIGLEVHDVSTGTINARENPHVPLPETQTNDVPTSPYRLQSAALLEPNMVLTVEPGIYFHRYAIEYYQSTDDPRLKYIDMELLERYYPVGGVRIEDDILVTETGYENITTAPKGEDMLDIIRNGWSTDKEDAGNIGSIV